MQDIGNDEFAGSITPDKIGLFEYKISGWSDPFRNWHIGFVKKSDSGDEKIAVELDIPIGTVKAQLFRARELLLNILNRSEEKP